MSTEICQTSEDQAENTASLSSAESVESESIAILKDNVFYDEEEQMTLGKLTRSLMFRPMWKDRLSALSVMSSYILAFSTFARFCYFFDLHGCEFLSSFERFLSQTFWKGVTRL
ncbi:hypothetical protein GCK32_001927 [Trichostrongylus colubriformis]|uniref:Uncharacterized protein n=1 Tax=Trichostrongylus colubriformis TaxID=6319 RepID=A0AAN8FAW5_TRICO